MHCSSLRNFHLHAQVQGHFCQHVKVSVRSTDSDAHVAYECRRPWASTCSSARCWRGWLMSMTDPVFAVRCCDQQSQASMGIHLFRRTALEELLQDGGCY